MRNLILLSVCWMAIAAAPGALAQPTPTPASPARPPMMTTPAPTTPGHSPTQPAPASPGMQPMSPQMPPVTAPPAPAPGATPSPMGDPTSPTSPTQAGCNTRTLAVPFGISRTDVSRDLQARLTEMAVVPSTCRIERVTVTGHADRSGNAASNRALSQRRADAVRNALVAQRVPAQLIQVAAEGDTQATGTATNDRRVDVVLSLSPTTAVVAPRAAAPLPAPAPSQTSPSPQANQ
jgi:outer membrane protein OmpA-like peptidoglycan-associated protein